MSRQRRSPLPQVSDPVARAMCVIMLILLVGNFALTAYLFDVVHGIVQAVQNL